jgi:hypothetical protein
MENHPLKNELELLFERKLKGDELVKILRHLAHCDECTQKIPKPDPQEVMKRLFADDEDDD